MIFGGKPCIDVGDLIRKAPGAGLPVVHIQSCGANYFALRSGSTPSAGRVLIRSDDFGTINRANSQSLAMPSGPTIPGIYVTAATRLFPGANDDPASPMVVDLADERWIKRHAPADVAYNLPDKNGTLYTATTNGGTPWTWTQVLSALWTLAGLTGTYAAPATVPAAAPQGFDFFGRPSALDCLEYALNQCGYTISHGIDGKYSFVALGQTPAVRTWDRVYDGRDDYPDAAEKPATIKTRFLRYPRPDGTSPYYLVSTSTGGTGTAVVQVDDGLAALGATGTPSNSAALATRAAERAANWLKLYARSKRRNVVYRGYQTYAAVGGDAAAVIYQERGNGPQTEIVAGLGNPPALALPLVDPASAGGITVKESDGSPSYAGVTSLEFEAARFVITQPGAGRANVDLATRPAPSTSPGAGNWSTSGKTSGTWYQTTDSVTIAAAGWYHVACDLNPVLLWEGFSIPTGNDGLSFAVEFRRAVSGAAVSQTRREVGFQGGGTYGTVAGGIEKRHATLNFIVEITAADVTAGNNVLQLWGRLDRQLITGIIAEVEMNTTVAAIGVVGAYNYFTIDPVTYPK